MSLQLSIIQEIPAEDLGYVKNEMAVRHCFKDLLTKPFLEFQPPSDDRVDKNAYVYTTTPVNIRAHSHRISP